MVYLRDYSSIGIRNLGSSFSGELVTEPARHLAGFKGAARTK